MHVLREHTDFRRLWLAQTISQIGSQISYLAVPLTAAATLNATPAEMGLLTAMGSIPSLIVGLPAGAFVDRRTRRPVLISADLARAALLGLIPLTWLLGALSIPLLYTVAFLGGACALCFDVAYQAFLPAVIDRTRLVEANSGLELSRSAAEVAGPTLAGSLVQLLKAPLAIAIDAFSFLVSAALIAHLKTKEAVRRASNGQGSFWADVVEGVRAVGHDPSIRALAIGWATLELFNAMLEAVVILYLTRSIRMEPGLLGVVFAAGGAGFVAGALLPGRITARFGVGPTMALAVAVVGLSDLALPVVGRDLVAVAVAVATGQFFFGLGMTVFNVTQMSLRQALVPDALMGRVSATLRVIGAGTASLGAVIGGLLGAGIGLRSTLTLAALLETTVAVWIWWSPLWSLRQIALTEER